MFDATLEKTEALWIANCSAIHCCFMSIEIDVLFLDKNGVVLYIIEHMKPWSFSKWVRQGVSVLECYPGTVSHYGLRVGEQLVMHPLS